MVIPGQPGARSSGSADLPGVAQGILRGGTRPLAFFQRRFGLFEHFIDGHRARRRARGRPGAPGKG